VFCLTCSQVLRLDEAGAVRRLRIKRRDLLREHRLQPRDLRRIDPTIDFTKTSPSITIKEDVLLLNLGGIRCGACTARLYRSMHSQDVLL
jgi:magnesium transporter